MFVSKSEHCNDNGHCETSMGQAWETTASNINKPACLSTGDASPFKQCTDHTNTSHTPPKGSSI